MSMCNITLHITGDRVV